MRLTPFSLIFILLLFITSHDIFSQSIKGRLTDTKNQPVPYAAVYDETTLVSTTSNADGYYELKLDPGNHAIVFKSMGYYIQRRNVNILDQPITIDIEFREQSVELAAVIIRPDKEDPAYDIMRKVIGRAPYHLNLVKEYVAEVYLRGTLQIVKIPKIIARNIEIEGKKNLIKNGDIFLDESMNEITFRAPDKYEQRVISFHNTYPVEINEAVSPAWIVQSSLYAPEIEDIISPLAPNAFSFYKYRYEGFIEEADHVVFKIKVTPKHNSQQLMSGYLYVIDKLWCLHSVDLSLNMFFGTISYKTIYSPVKNNAWLPITYQFYVDAKLMGMKGNYKYSGSVKFKEVVFNESVSAIIDLKENQPAPEPEENTTPAVPVSKDEIRKQKQQQKLESLLAKEELNNRDMMKMAKIMNNEVTPDTVDKKSLELKDSPYTQNKVTTEEDALKKDTAYWNEIRPIPLTKTEKLIPGLDDQGPGIASDTINKNDSVTTVGVGARLGKFAGFILAGTSHHIFDSSFIFRYNGVIGLKKFDFNTVDGFIYRQTFGLSTIRNKNGRSLNINTGIAYAFIRKRFMWWTDVNFNYSLTRTGNLHFYIGSTSADYNSESGINSTINSIASLFFRRNYMKLYQRNLASLSNSIEIATGLHVTTSIGYQTSRPLYNHSDYSFFYRNTREYSPNAPGIDSVNHPRNVYNEEAYWDAYLEYTPRHYYYRLPNGRKIYQNSKFPTFFIRNRMAIPGIVSSTTDYNLLEIGAKQHINWGLAHSFTYYLKGGFFLNRNTISLMQDKYFNNQDVPVIIGSNVNAFNLLPFYRNSTTRNYVEAHIKFTTPYLLVKYLPFLSNKLWVEDLRLNYLTTSEQSNYWEAGYSISNIYFMGSIGIYAGFKDWDFKKYGIQISLEF